MAELEKLMRDLSNADGVPGFEKEVRAKMNDYLAPLSDEIVKDRLGGILGKKTGDANGPRVLVAGHMDEVGFMVTSITKGGFLRFQPLGGWFAPVMQAHRVKVKTRKGDYVGLIGGVKPPHLLTPAEREKVLPISEMFIDIGASSKEEAEEMGVRPGDAIVPMAEFFTMRGGDLWAGKALDNRAGCALAIDVLQKLQGQQHPNTVYAGATVQEEVGLRGATTAAHLVQPDIAFALDVGLAVDTPGFEPDRVTNHIGDGPLLFVYDATMVPHVGLRDLVLDTAEELGIPVQYESMPGGGTDAGRFHSNGIGCPSRVIGFATRYIHTHTAVMARRDFELASQLLTAVIQKLDAKTVEELFEA